MKQLIYGLAAVQVMIMASCASYKQNVMFRAPEGYSYQPNPTTTSISGFTILPDDQLSIEVFTNNGERIIDPNPELSTNVQNPGEKKEFIYPVDEHGVVKLPMIGNIELGGMNLQKAEEAVQQAYQKFYKEPFVIIKFNNKRVILLGALGGQVIPLTNQHTRLTEVLALGKGLDVNAKAQNIRVIRGNEVFKVDLSTIEGFQAGNLMMESGDIVYVEPIRRPFSEALRENSSILGLLVSLASLVVVISTVTR